jgi:hypothetical protein
LISVKFCSHSVRSPAQYTLFTMPTSSSVLKPCTPHFWLGRRR